MTSTPVSLVESTNGSWIDIACASQIPSPTGNISPAPAGPPVSLAQSVHNLPFQVERYLQEANKDGPQGDNTFSGDINSGIYSSNSDISLVDHEQEVMMNNLRNHYFFNRNNSEDLQYQYSSQNLFKTSQADILDCLSDSVSLLDRLSEAGGERRECHETGAKIQEFDWLWEWTKQPEYFSGNEWKIYAPKNEYLSQQRQLIKETMDRRTAGDFFTRDVISLLFLTNILSIIIGAGLTYGFISNKSSI